MQNSKNYNDLINGINKRLLDKANDLNNIPIIEYGLGTLLFIATQYAVTKKISHKKQSLVMMNKFFGDFETFNYTKTGILEGFDGIAWTILCLKKYNLINDLDIISELESELIKSIYNDIDYNNFDLLYGSIGKFNYFLETRSKEDTILLDMVDNFIKSLEKNAIVRSFGIFWDNSFQNDGRINMGIAHGLSSVLLILTKFIEKGIRNSKIEFLIDRIIGTIMHFKNSASSPNYFNSYCFENEDYSRYSRLAWCTGDLSICFALLYSSVVLNNRRLKETICSIIDYVSLRGIENSGLCHFSDYSFFDVAFCHGISGISLLYQNIRNFYQSKTINFRYNYWINELMKNTESLLKVKGNVYYPFTHQDENNSFLFEENALLNGLTGVGLVLLGIKHNETFWSRAFLLN